MCMSYYQNGLTPVGNSAGIGTVTCTVVLAPAVVGHDTPCVQASLLGSSNGIHTTTSPFTTVLSELVTSSSKRNYDMP